MSFDQLSKAVDDGLSGNNKGIPMGFDRLNNYIGIRKGMYFLIGGLTGSGKTSFIDDCFVLNPLDWYLSKENTSNVKLKIIYRSMERSRVYKLAKWISRKIFIDQGMIVPMEKILGWRGRMTPIEHDMFKFYEDYINEALEVVTIIDGPENPIGVAKELKEHALKRGKIEQLDQFNKVYIPDDPTEITVVIIDHAGKLKLTQTQPTKKAAIDKMSDELSYARDFYGYTPVVVSQFNRDISNPVRLRNGDVEPMLEDFKESGQTQDDADVVLSLFDPVRYKVKDFSGYDTNRMIDEYGNKYFRSLRILKNSYGPEDVRIGMAFMGEVGIFKELPKRSELKDTVYDDVLNKSYFVRTYE